MVQNKPLIIVAKENKFIRDSIIFKVINSYPFNINLEKNNPLSPQPIQVYTYSPWHGQFDKTSLFGAMWSGGPHKDY